MTTQTQDIFNQVNREIADELSNGEQDVSADFVDTYDAPPERHDSIRELIEFLFEDMGDIEIPEYDVEETQ